MAALVYVGPTVKGTMLKRFRIYADGVPEEYRDDAVVKRLFVPPEKLDEARRAAGRKGSALNVACETVGNNHLKKKGGN